jgi:ABC-type Mn2+/Zn2+ transport system permease subunit
MLMFFLEVIAVSIAVSLFASWANVIPRYLQRKYSLIQQALNTTILTGILTVLFVFEIYPSWIFMFGLILLVLWISVRTTKFIIHTQT